MNWMRARVLVPMAIVGSLFMCNGQDTATATFERILPTLALIIGRMPNSTSSGTGFCIWSNASKSYFLTNQHVIEGASEVLLRLQAFELPRSKALVKGRVYPRGSLYLEFGMHDPSLNQDLAVIVVDVGRVPYITFQVDQPKAGRAIGIAGFPSFRFEPPNNTQSVSPSVHFGTVNSLPGTSSYLEFDAVADHGNSGGPMFDRTTGLVYGVVTLGIPSKTSPAVQNNLAISSNSVALFLRAMMMARASVSKLSGKLEDIPCMSRTGKDALRERAWCSLPDAVTSR